MHPFRGAFISIHALREEGDASNPQQGDLCAGFLSTPSARRATELYVAAFDRMLISIHALREEGDVGLNINTATDFQFLSTPSARRATGIAGTWGALIQFLSTPSARRATCSVSGPAKQAKNFYPRPPRGGRPFVLLAGEAVPDISIHALREEGDTNTTQNARK